jgi:hypothetical protein
MRRMAESLTAMADMCQAMMREEMAGMALKRVLVTVSAVLLAIALLLFIVLEVYWIRHWHRKLSRPDGPRPSGSPA